MVAEETIWSFPKKEYEQNRDTQKYINWTKENDQIRIHMERCYPRQELDVY